MNVIVTRQPNQTAQTLGKLEIFSNVVIYECATLELPWKDNQKQISCIPVGAYQCEKVAATANIPYEHISIKNVSGRSGVCIHKANYVNQLKGCIAVGKSHIDMNNDGLKDVNASGKAFSEIMALLPKEFKLTIKNK